MSDRNLAPDQIVFSACKDGRQVALSASFQKVHEGTESDSGEDWEVFTIEVCNIDTSSRVLFIGLGSQNAADQIVMTMSPREGAIPIVIKRRMKRGTTIWARGSVANVLNLYGEVGVLDGQETV